MRTAAWGDAPDAYNPAPPQQPSAQCHHLHERWAAQLFCAPRAPFSLPRPDKWRVPAFSRYGCNSADQPTQRTRRRRPRLKRNRHCTLCTCDAPMLMRWVAPTSQCGSFSFRASHASRNVRLATCLCATQLRRGGASRWRRGQASTSCVHMCCCRHTHCPVKLGAPDRQGNGIITFQSSSTVG